MQSIDLDNAVILDTETTGLSMRDEICEVSVIDALAGQPLLDTLIKPTTNVWYGNLTKGNRGGFFSILLCRKRLKS